MPTKPYWWITRPQRKPVNVPQSLSAFAGVASGQKWSGNRALQMAYEDRLVELGLKRQGEYTERARGRGGSGGRTHASLLYSLGLFFLHQDSLDSDEEVHLTLAGQALVDQEDALPILRKQILAYQFPSAHSVAQDVDRKFKLRPFVALLKLLKHPQLHGYLTDREIAACVITYMTSHSDRAVEQAAERIRAFRLHDTTTLEESFARRFASPTSKKTWTAEELIKGGSTLGDIANTFVQWLRYIGYAVPAPGEAYGARERTVTALNPPMEDEVDHAVDEWASKPLATMYEPEDDKFALAESAKAFQRGYGVKVGMRKDQRTIRDIRGRGESERNHALVTGSLTRLYETEMVTEVTDDVIDAVVNHCGLDRQTVARTLASIISSPAVGKSAFLDRYEQMAYRGTEEAITFEKATETVLSEVFGLGSEHVGQAGTVPDVEVWSDSWGGIIDTKAYAAYDLPHDHQLRMHADYVPDYAAGVQGRPLRFFMYIAGGFVPSFDGKLRNVIDKAGISGSGISMRAWRNLIHEYPKSGMAHDDLLDLWSLGREITVQDVAEVLGEANQSSGIRSANDGSTDA